MDFIKVIYELICINFKVLFLDVNKNSIVRITIFENSCFFSDVFRMWQNVASYFQLRRDKEKSSEKRDEQDFNEFNFVSHS